MKNVLEYVPGFRSNKKWKKVVASIYYAIAIITLFTSGFGSLLTTVAIPFILFTGIRVVKHRDKSVEFVLVGSIVLFIFGAVLSSGNDSTVATTPVNKTVASEVVPVVTERVKTAEEIKKEEDQAKLDAIQKAKDDAAAKVIADAQAVKDKETARLQAIADKKVADAKILADKKAAAAAIQAEKVAYDTGITYNQLARTPDKYIASKVKFYGKVIQVIEDGTDVQLRIAINDDYDNILLATYSASLIESRILENDEITIKGVSAGVITYESTMGGNITIPAVVVNSIN